MRKLALFSLVLSSIIYADTRLDTSVISTTGFEGALGNEVRNVTVITKDDIRNRGIRSLREVFERAPSVNVLGNAVGTPLLDMRGQGSAKASTHVKVMLNDVSINLSDSSHTSAPLETLSIEDIERIEIIPGGGAVMYGSGTQGGIVNIITKSKPRDFYANISSRYGSGPYHDGRVNIGGLVSDNLFLKSSIWAFNDKKYRHNERSRGTYGSLGANYQIDDNQYINGDFSYYKGRMQGAGASTKAEIDENRRATKTERYGLNFWTGRFEMLSDIYVDDVRRSAANLEYGIKFNNNYDFKITPFYQRTMYDTFGDKKYGAKAKLKYDYESGNIIFGYDYIVHLGFISNGSKLRKNTNSAFVLNEFDFSNNFSLAAGYRFENAKYNLNKGGIFRKTLNNHAFELTPNYKYSDTGNIYFKFERGFTSPPVNKMTNGQPGPGGRLVYFNSNIDSEIYNTYEIGLKDTIADSFFSATVFLTDTKDEIVTDMKGWNWKQLNLGKTRRYGFELFAEQYLLDSSLRLSESFSYTHTEVTKGNKKFVGSYEKGDKIPYVPKYKFVLGADYDITNNLGLFLNSKFYGSSINGGKERIKSYNVTDIGASYKYKGFDFIAGINNIFAEKYYYTYSPKNDSYVPAEGRNYFIELKYNF